MGGEGKGRGGEGRTRENLKEERGGEGKNGTITATVGFICCCF